MYKQFLASVRRILERTQASPIYASPYKKINKKRVQFRPAF